VRGDRRRIAAASLSLSNGFGDIADPYSQGRRHERASRRRFTHRHPCPSPVPSMVPRLRYAPVPRPRSTVPVFPYVPFMSHPVYCLFYTTLNPRVQLDRAEWCLPHRCRHSGWRFTANGVHRSPASHLCLS